MARAGPGVLLDQIDLYLRRADGSVVHQVSGDQRPFQSRAYNYLLTIVPAPAPGTPSTEPNVRTPSGTRNNP